MKKVNLIGIVLLVFSGLSAHAQGGHVGGGDLCRNEINKHRQMIADWIGSGDAAELDFSKAMIKNQTFSTYRDRMLTALAPDKVVVTCYFDPGRIGDPEAQKIAKKDGVAFKAITLGDDNLPTSCINYEDNAGVSHIDCNYDAIVNKEHLQNPNYVFTHHEYASIAGVELRLSGSEPDFSISDQLAQFEQWISVKKLGKKRAGNIINSSGGKLLFELNAGTYFSFAKMKANPDDATRAKNLKMSRYTPSMAFLDGGYATSAFWLYRNSKEGPLCNLNFRRNHDITKAMAARKLMIASITTLGKTKSTFYDPKTGRVSDGTDSSTWIVIEFLNSPVIKSLECRPEGKTAEEFTVEDLKDAFGETNIQVIE